MSDLQGEFIYASRRACEEELAAINAKGEAASRVHRTLSCLYAMRARVALSALDPIPRPVARVVRATAARSGVETGSAVGGAGLC